MKIIFEAMKRIEATRIVEFNSHELGLVIDALMESGCYDCSLIAKRLAPMRAVNETPLLYNELVDRHIENELARMGVSSPTKE